MKRRAPTTTRSRGTGVTTAARRSTTVHRAAVRPARPSGKRSSAGRVGVKAAHRGRSAKGTTDHDEIREWVEARGGHPATVKRTAKGGQAAGIIRIDFPGYSGQQTLKPITWEEWFRIFDERGLTFLYQNKTATGKPSRFNKLVSRE